MRSWSLSHFLLLAVGYRLVVALYLELVSSVLPLFDPTPADFLPSTSWLQPFVRWDVLWFLPVALRGSYKHEQETAFGWGWVGTMRALGRVVNWLQGKDELDAADLVLGGVVGSWLAGLGATAALYYLTLRLTSSPAFTWTTVALYILSPSPGALVSPYTEPLYAVLSFSGMLLSLPPPSSGCKLRALRLTGAAVCFAGSTSVRPTGMLNAGFLVWYGLVGPWLRGQRRASQTTLRMASMVILSLVVASPFFYAQYGFYLQFCNGNNRPAWCANRLPLLYTHVQQKYWDVGFLKYWTVLQSPNFAIAAPVYYVLFSHHWTYLSLHLPSYVRQLFNYPSPMTPSTSAQPEHPSASLLVLLPFVLHSTVLTLVLALNAHVQIALRLAQTNPVFYWALASLFQGCSRQGVEEALGLRGTGRMGEEDKWQRRRLGREATWYVRWIVGWNVVAPVLWAGFYPPA